MTIGCLDTDHRPLVVHGVGNRSCLNLCQHWIPVIQQRKGRRRISHATHHDVDFLDDPPRAAFP